MDILNFLKNEITGKDCLEDLIGAFEKMCQLPIGGISDDQDMILFETGIYSFTGEPLFYFSLTRQFPNEGEEYYQLHLDVMYTPTETLLPFRRTDWSMELAEDIFDHIRSSDEYLALKNVEIQKINVYMDET